MPHGPGTTLPKAGEQIAIAELTPSLITLEQNYPNPVVSSHTPETVISYHVPEDMRVMLEVRNSVGRVVDVLVDGRVSAGRHTVTFNATAKHGALPTGQYLIVMRAGNAMTTRMMTVIK